jgi:YegS/Rv2252/BmrU family lipid kinase
MKTFLVVNPQSANGETGRRWVELSAKIGAALGEFGHAFTRGPMDAAVQARKALEAGYECIVAVGGDGTVNEVVNGFFSDGVALNPKAALGVLPRGTGGDFKRTFGWDNTLEGALARLRTDRTEPFDVGLLEYLGHDGAKAKRYFANICSFGASGLVDQEVNKSSKALGGKLSFMLGSVKALMKYSDRTVHFSLDGGREQQLQVTTFSVANGKYFGGGMKVAPEASTSDGQFDVTVWTGYGLMDFALKSKAIYDGSHTKFPGTRQFKCRSMSARGEGEVLLDVDGEQPGKLPCTMTVLPSAIRVKV